MGGSPTDPLHNVGGICLENDAVVNDFVNGERDKVVILNDGPLVDGLPGKSRLVQRQAKTRLGMAHLKRRCKESRKARTVL